MHLGIDQFPLFPSLDGLAAHIEWLLPARVARCSSY